MNQSELYIKLDRLTSLVEMMWLAGRAGDINNLDEYHNEANPLGFEMMRLIEQKGLDCVSEPGEDKKTNLCPDCHAKVEWVQGWYDCPNHGQLKEHALFDLEDK